MSELTVIRALPHVHKSDGKLRRLVLRADRLTLAKRRWRAAAEDGREFGFDLETPLKHDDCFFIDETSSYFLEQQPEPVLEIPISTPEEAASIAWKIGNLHLGIQVLPSVLRVIDDSAAAQMLTREGIAFQRHAGLFLPLATGGSHHQHHHQEHE